MFPQLGPAEHGSCREPLLLSKFFRWEYFHAIIRGTENVDRRIKLKEKAMKTYLAEDLGTFLLVFIGTASVVTGGFGGALPLGQEGIGLAFGIGLIAAAYAIGPISGAHLNPAVTLGVFLAGRLPAKDVIPYWISADHRRHPGLAGIVDHRLRPGRRTHRQLRRRMAGMWRNGASARRFLWELVGTFGLRHGDPRRHH